MRLRLSLVLFSLLQCCFYLLESKKTLLLLESLDLQETHTEMFSFLRQRHHELDIHLLTDQTVSLFKYNERLYENIMILTRKPKKIASLTLKNILSFIEDGGNVFVATSNKVTRFLRQFAAECGVSYASRNTYAIDHFSNTKDELDLHHTNILSNNTVNSTGIGLYPTRPIAFIKGLGMTLEEDNILTFPILSGMPSTYVSDPIEYDAKEIEGTNIALIAAVQTRNLARVIFSGSVEMYSDSYIKNNLYGNKELMKSILIWNFGEKSVLKVKNIQHYHCNGQDPEKMLKEVEKPDMPISLYPEAEMARNTLVYRIKDNLTYAFTVEELVAKGNDSVWKPFTANDIQIEFVMLDPYVRKTVKHLGNGRYSTTFIAPDQYGIFRFRVMYQRVGYSTLTFETQVSLRPYKHDEYPRFLLQAYPYYITTFTVMGSVFVFSLLFLYTK